MKKKILEIGKKKIEGKIKLKRRHSNLLICKSRESSLMGKQKRLWQTTGGSQICHGFVVHNAVPEPFCARKPGWFLLLLLPRKGPV